jgi:hypothetical protein
MIDEKLKIKNPIIKAGLYFLISLILGIGAVWILLGIISPVLLLLLIQKWH